MQIGQAESTLVEEHTSEVELAPCISTGMTPFVSAVGLCKKAVDAEISPKAIRHGLQQKDHAWQYSPYVWPESASVAVWNKSLMHTRLCACTSDSTAESRDTQRGLGCRSHGTPCSAAIVPVRLHSMYSKLRSGHLRG